MFNFFKKDPKKRIEQDYARKLAEAMEAQRNGDIRLYSSLMEEANKTLKRLDQFDAADSHQ